MNNIEHWDTRERHGVFGIQGKVQVQVVFDTNTFWLSQQRMAELFGVTQQNISYHLSQTEESGELHLSDAYKKICYLRTNGQVRC